MTAVASKPRKAVSAKWRKLLLLVPGYDCFATAEDCWFDESTANRAIEFIENCLTHVKAQKGPFLLEPWEKAIVGNLFGWKRPDGTRRYREAFIYVPRKNGKALALDTPIPTPEGWRAMGDINCGDVVYAADGSQAKVLNAFDALVGRKCYRVRFSDDTEIVCDAEHEWETDARSDRDRLKGRGGKTAGPKPSVKTTQQILETLSFSKGDKTEWNHRIPVCGPLQNEDAQLPIDPYVLGAWLGDGNSASARFTCSSDDIEVIEHLRSSGSIAVHKQVYQSGKSKGENYLLTRPDGYCSRGHYLPETTTIGRKHNRCGVCENLVRRARYAGQPVPMETNKTVQEILRDIEVLNNKHIPAKYLQASEAQRLALLQGLMDTDGYASKAGQCEFTTTSDNLRDGVLELIRSLGMKPSVKCGRATLYGKDCGPKYRIQFWAFSDCPVFRLSRKADRLKSRPVTPTRTSYRQIVSIEPVPSVPVRCIEIDHPSHLYLAGAGMVPTHNSALAAAIVLTIAFLDKEPGAELYSAAANSEQALMVFDQAKGMVEQEPDLNDECTIYKATKTILKEGHWYYKALSSDAGCNHGKNVHLAIVDELHEQPNRDMVDALQTSTGVRKQPLIIYITTADYNRVSICNEKYDYACDIRDQKKTNVKFLPVIYEAKMEEDWTDPRVWEKANPNLGVSVTYEYLEGECKKAQEIPAYENTFRRLHLCQRTQQDVRAIPMDQWDKCGGNAKPSEWRTQILAAMKGRQCVGGLDIAGVSDLTALALLFGDCYSGFDVVPFFWCPAQTAEKRSRRDGVDYVQWGRAGFIKLTDGNETDYQQVRRDINALAKDYGIYNLAVDRLFQGAQLCQDLGADGMNITDFGQGYQDLAAPTKVVLELLAGTKLRHGNNPVLRWMAQNTASEDCGGPAQPILKFSKKKSTEKIDGIMAMTMGVGVSAKGGAVQEPQLILL